MDDCGTAPAEQFPVSVRDRIRDLIRMNKTQYQLSLQSLRRCHPSASKVKQSWHQWQPSSEFTGSEHLTGAVVNFPASDAGKTQFLQCVRIARSAQHCTS